MDVKSATVGLFFLFIFFSNISIIGSANVTVALQPVSRENATTAELSCSFTVDDSRYTFYSLKWVQIYPEDNTIVSFTARSTHPNYEPRYSQPQYSATRTDFESKLTISSVKHEDTGIYACEVNFRDLSGTELHKVAVTALTVYVPPQALTITHHGNSYEDGASIPVLAKKHRKFTCTANGITPAATFKWSGSGTNSSVGTPTQTDTTTTTATTTSTRSTSVILVNIPENPETLSLECQAYNTHDGSNGASIAVTLEVRVPPKVVVLSDASGNKTDVVEVAVYEGTPHESTCLVQGTRPAATIRWFIGGVPQSAGVGTHTTLISNNLYDRTGILAFIPSRAEHEKELTCQAYIAESLQPYPASTVLLLVYGPPNTPIISGMTSPMTEGIPVNLTCEADMGYPDDWRLDWARGKSPVTMPGTTNTSVFDNRYNFTSVLDFTPDRADNGNRVTCTANREADVTGPAGSTNVLNVQFGARIINKGENSTVVLPGEDSVIICIVDGNPIPTVRWYFQHNTSIDTLPGNNVTNETATGDGIHGFGVRSNLTVTIYSLADYGIYTCTASNGIGGQDSLNMDITGLRLTIAHNHDNTTLYSDGASIPVLSGNGSQFTCTANGITAAPTFIWALSEGGTYLPVGTPNQTDTLTSTITVDIPENPEMLSLGCTAYYNTPGSKHRSHIGVTLQVRVPPKAVKLSDANGDKTNGVTATVYEGTTHNFTCMVQGTRPAATIRWFIGNDRQLFGVSTSTNTSNNLYDTTGTLAFIPSRADQGKELKCEAYIAESRWPYPTSGVLLDVYVQPRALTIAHNTTSYNNGASIPVLSGNGSQFTCTANAINPAATFAWSLSDGGTNLPVGTPNQTNTPTNASLMDSTSSITVDIPENPATLTLGCKAYNTLNESNGARIAVTLQVRVPPKAVKLSDANGDKTNGVTVTVYEGTPHNFTCMVQGTRPAATIRWFIGNDRQLFGVSTSTNTSNNLYDTTGTLAFIPSRADQGKELKCEAYIAESRWPYPTSSMLLDVYVLTLDQELVEVPNKNGTKQQSRFAVRCTVENAVTYDWYKIGAEGNRDFIASGYTLIFSGFEDVQDQGTYICVGRGRDNATEEHETLVVRSGASTLLASMTMPHEVFTANLSNLSSDAATRLKTRIHNVLLNDAMNDFRSGHVSGGSWEVVRFSPGSVILNMAVVVTPYHPTSDEDLKVSLMTIMSNHIANDTASSEMFDSRTLHVVSLSSCPQSVWTIEGANVTFPETRVKQKVELLRLKCTLGSKEGTMSVSRACVGDFVGTAHWLNPEASNCITDISQQLEALSNVTVTRDNVNKVGQSLESLTSDPSAVDGRMVSLVASTLDNIIAVRDPSPEVTSTVVSVVNNLLQVDSGAFNATQNAAATSRIVKALESQVSYVLEDGANFTQVTTSLAVQALNVTSSSLTRGITFAANNKDNLTLTEDQVDVHYMLYDAVQTELVQTSIALPNALVEHLPTESTLAGISFILYQNSKLFPSLKIKESHQLVEGAVISASVLGVRLRDLPEESPVVGTFRRSQDRGGQPSCVFWDTKLNDGIGDWSREGCRRVTLDTNGWTVCHCDHATSFAVLVDIYGKASSSLALDIVSKVGCGISVAALLLTIIIYTSIKSLRSKTPGRILVCLSASLLCLYLVFLVGIEQTSSPVVCNVVAALLHFFTLTTVAWMGVEATNIYIMLVKLSPVGVRHFMIKASLVAWGFPMLVVGVIMAVDRTVYQNEISCFMKPGAAFYYGQLLIIGLILLYNALIFVLVTHQLTCKRRKIQRSSTRRGKHENVRRLQNISSIAVLLGLTWAFGVLSILESSTFVFQILFSIFNSLQGLFIFLLFVVRQEKIRVMIGGKLIRQLSRGQSELTTESSNNASCSKSISIKDKDNNTALEKRKSCDRNQSKEDLL